MIIVIEGVGSWHIWVLPLSTAGMAGILDRFMRILCAMHNFWQVLMQVCVHRQDFSASFTEVMQQAGSPFAQLRHKVMDLLKTLLDFAAQIADGTPPFWHLIDDMLTRRHQDPDIGPSIAGLFASHMPTKFSGSAGWHGNDPVRLGDCLFDDSIEGISRGRLIARIIRHGSALPAAYAVAVRQTKLVDQLGALINKRDVCVSGIHQAKV